MPTKKTPAKASISVAVKTPTKVKTAPKAKVPAKAKTPSKATAKAKAQPSVKVEVRNIPKERQIAHSVLKLVDEAASLLHKGISTTATTSEKTRIASAKKAHSLLGQASGFLTSAIGEGTKDLQKVLGKLGG